MERRLAFIGRRFEPWLAMAATTPWLLSFAINTLVDNEHGTYRINHPVEFGLVTAAMLAGTYVVLRLALIPIVVEMRAQLHDLRAQVIEAMPRAEAVRRRSRAWSAAGAVVLALAVLFSLWLWLRAA